MRLTFPLLAAIAASTPSIALADEPFAVMPSGATEMLFPDDPQVVVGKLAATCIDGKWRVITSTGSEVICEAPLDLGESIAAAFFVESRYSTPTTRYFRFNVAGMGGVSRVQASGWIENQSAFGQVRRNDFSGPAFHNNMVAFMLTAGGSYPAGTTFPNHVVLGVQGKHELEGKRMTLRIIEVEDGSPAARAGLREGDIIYRIAGSRWKSYEGYLNATAKAARTETYPVEFTRDGLEMSANLSREFRLPITEGPEPSEAPSPSTAPASIADELEKLSQLRERGILTDDEFEGQKAKLLSD